MPSLAATIRRPSPSGALACLAGTLALLAWIGFGGTSQRNRPAPAPPSPRVVEAEPLPAPAPPMPPKPVPAVVEPDRGAVARAEADLDAATRARAEAEARLADAEIALRKATLASAAGAAEGRGLAYQVRDPSARIERAANLSSRTKWETKRLEDEIATLDAAPRPKARPLQDRGAVARPIDGKEYHFEVHGDRVAFIDIERLTDLVKTEVRLQLRMSVRGQPFGGEVGPVGEFTMKYEMGTLIPEALVAAIDRREISYQLRGWEIVPERPDRGETWERAREPVSAYARAVNRLNPERATITFWIYPDGFALYRRLRDDLHGRGFLVAARPLPEGMTIRGSPAGSLSAGQ
jgi:hypothetical protein